MMKFYACCAGILCVVLGACGEIVVTSKGGQTTITEQGISMQGISMQGISMQGMAMRGFRIDGATLAGQELTDLHVERGEVIAERGEATLRGAALAGAHLRAEVRDLAATPPRTELVEYRIASVTAEDEAHDPTGTGSTFLYTLEQWVSETSAWQPACNADADGRRAAIPLAATWDERGDRIESSAHFTFGCTTGVIAKCYRWGYRPWIEGYGDLAAMHWTCTRLARADYCGDGVPHTFNGTLINVWDTLPAPGPIQTHGPERPPGMHFEAGWNTSGAVCVDHERWKEPGQPDSLCPGRWGSHPPRCKSVEDVLEIDPSAQMFTESRKRVAHGG